MCYIMPLRGKQSVGHYFLTFSQRSAMIREGGPSGGNSPRKRVLLTVSGGGFYWQSRSVARGIVQDVDLYYVTPENSHAFDGQGMPEAPFHEVSSITTMEDSHPLKQGVNFVKALADTYRVMREVNPDAVVCVAVSLAIPLCFWAKFLGKRAIFIESITRIKTPSITGRILAALHLCDRFYVQWPEACALYRGAIFRGAVL